MKQGWEYKKLNEVCEKGSSNMRVCQNDASSFFINKTPTFTSQGFVMSKRICIFRH